MSKCPNCGTENIDGATFCTGCGANLAAGTNPVYTPAPYAIDPYDHTAEMDPRDISENKVWAIVPYLFSILGMILAKICSPTSKFVDFHVKQAIKINIVQIFLMLIAAVLCWTIIIPIAAGICNIIIFVIEVITFFQAMSGKAKEPAIIRSLKFLK